MKRNVGTLAATLITAVLLTGCTATDVFTGARTATPTSTSTPTPTAIAGDSNGDGKLSEHEKQVAAKKAPRDYTLPNGTVIAVDPTQPLPQEIVDAIVVQAKPIADSIDSFYADETEPGQEGIRAIAKKEAAATGKPVVIVYSRPATDGGIAWGSIPSEMKSTGIPGSKDKAAFVATMTKWAEPRGYALIVID